MKIIKKESKFLIYDSPMNIDWKYFVKIFLWKARSVYYRCYLEMHHPVVAAKKYNVSICAIFRDEGRYLKEWLEYHLLIGVDHFYLYNNFSNDNYMDILKKYIENGKVTLVEWAFELGQPTAYRDCINKYKSESKWIGFIDLDEFIIPDEGRNIYALLKPFEEKRPSVLLYWRYFGTSGFVTRDETSLVLEDFVVCWPKYANIGKCFYNTAFDFDPNYKGNVYMHHILWGKMRSLNIPPVNLQGYFVIYGLHKIRNMKISMHINHYLLKSYDEYWSRKSKKGGGTHDVGMHDKEYFYEHENMCSTVDFSAYKFLVDLKNSIVANN